ncbi:MAG: 50S ribosomal protein L21 [Fimbriimonadia bacterium]|jgi:large subunit ribosomal protein L21
MYAIVQSGGKQYRAEKDATLILDRIEGDSGSRVELDHVLLVRTESGVKVGTPYVLGAKVVGTIVRQARGRKVVGLKYKAKKRYKRRYGFRPELTFVRVNDIVGS